MAGSLLPPAVKAQYEEQVREQATVGCTPSKKPKAIILAGQPGAGKSKVAAKARERLAETGQPVTLDPDEARRLHPLHGPLMNRDDKTAADLTHQDASDATDSLRKHAIEQRFNIVVDGTLKTPEKAEALVQELIDAGYEIEIVALCVDPDTSFQSVNERYEKEKAANGSGRFVPKEVHDAAVTGMVQSVQALEKQGLVSSIQVVTRDGDVLHESHPSARPPGAPNTAENIKNVFDVFGGRVNLASGGGPLLVIDNLNLIICTGCPKPQPLKVTMNQSTFTSGQLEATIADCVPMVNILPFGPCVFTPLPPSPSGGPCIPKPVGMWGPGSLPTSDQKIRSLRQVDTLQCGSGGTISVSFAGQNSVFVK
jgi:predicted kinase